MNPHAAVVERIIVFHGEGDDVNFVTQGDECLRNAIDVVGQATIEVRFSYVFRCGECNSQLHARRRKKTENIISSGALLLCATSVFSVSLR